MPVCVSGRRIHGERLRKLRDGFKHTKLQMLFRGQNILDYRHYADDVVEYFVQEIHCKWY